MSNLAYQVQKQQVQLQPERNPKPVQQPSRKIFTKGEVVLWGAMGVVLIAGLIWLISLYASVYQATAEVESIQKDLTAETKIVEDYHLQVTELSNPERIMKLAKKQGFIFDDKNVKVVQD
ncbi:MULTISPECIES: cell division protein FtsL [Fictibacillus]|uniref:cell division protein FtsL n=1 Tax=Fictibacillus TaxID=1329200 RepID=UPI0018CEEAA5|nr:cell division protein FtsL [Fictibacillus sp. 5RED26]MBH0161084.1 cell division protein FtsL [Fictibacillus sp. 26RED30]MBH0165976.1 cell division protein FtsL [Fictibacillus sp. 7GRE50]MBH0172975.1 cell division protein FtsL [Fictibacillus sp. 23RED33]